MTNYADNLVSFIWDVADLLRGPYRPPEYRKVMLPMTVLRRLDCVLEATKDRVIEENKKLKGQPAGYVHKMLLRAAKQPFYNTSKYDFERLKGDPDGLAQNLLQYIRGFSKEVRDLFEHFAFEQQIQKLDKTNRLFKLVSKFADVDLHTNTVTNLEMGRTFEELVRKFNEAANEEAGDHFTPREVIRLMVNLVFSPDSKVLSTKAVVRTLFDPAAGTGGMLSEASKYMRELNDDARLILFGQDYNPEAYAICGSDMLMKGEDIEHIQFGDSLGDGRTTDAFPRKKFDYMLANPPFGVKWEAQEQTVRRESEDQGFDGRFGAGLPRINDGSFLFLQHMISKMQPYSHADKTGTRLAIVFNGSPLFSGDAGSGESNIRKWIIENDWLEGIVALPDQLFYNTGINTYLWIVTNRKSKDRRGKVQLVDASSFFVKMRKSAGDKRNLISDAQIDEITKIYGAFEPGEYSKTFANSDFGYRKITVERPLRLSFSVNPERLDTLRASKPFEALATSRKAGKEGKKEIETGQQLQEQIVIALESLSTGEIWKSRKAFMKKLDSALEAADLSVKAPIYKAILNAMAARDEGAEVCRDSDGDVEPDPELRDTENVPLNEDIHEYFKREVKPHVPDAWIDEEKTKIGYEIPFTRHFYKYTPPRRLEVIEAEIRELEGEIVKMLAAVGR